MIIIFIAVVMSIGSNALSVAPDNREYDIQKQIKFAHELISAFRTTRSTSSPFNQGLEKMHRFRSPQDSSSLSTTPPNYPTDMPKIILGPIGPGFKYTIPKLPIRPSYSPTYKFQDADRKRPEDYGLGTMKTWATWFTPSKPTTKYRTWTLRPDTLTDPITEPTSTLEETYNPIKQWYDHESTNTKYWWHRLTSNPDEDDGSYQARRTAVTKSAEWQTTPTILQQN